MNDPVFYDGLSGLIRIAIAAPVLFCAMILFIGVAGGRTTSQMNNLDWMETFALGSLTAVGILVGNVTLLETLLAGTILVMLHWTATKYVIQARDASHAGTAEPKLLVSDGRFLFEALAREHIEPDQVLAAVRGRGLASLDEVQWVVLEKDATMSVIPRSSERSSLSAVSEVHGFSSERRRQ